MEKARYCPTHRARRQPGCPGCRRYMRDLWNLGRHGTITPPPAVQPAQPVRDHIRALLDAGMRLVDVATDAGMRHVGQLNRIMYSSQPTVTRRTAENILAVRARPADRWWIDGIGVRRRARALAMAGWHLGQVAERAGYSSTAEKVALLRRHLGTLAPSTLACRLKTSRAHIGRLMRDHGLSDGSVVAA